MCNHGGHWNIISIPKSRYMDLGDGEILNGHEQHELYLVKQYEYCLEWGRG